MVNILYHLIIINHNHILLSIFFLLLYLKPITSTKIIFSFLCFKVHMKGMSLFTEIANSLKTIQFDGTTSNRGSIREFSEVEKMLNQEREEFEVRFLLAHDFDLSCV